MKLMLYNQEKDCFMMDIDITSDMTIADIKKKISLQCCVAAAPYPKRKLPYSLQNQKDHTTSPSK